MAADDLIASASVAVRVDGETEAVTPNFWLAEFDLTVGFEVDAEKVKVASGSDWVATSSNALKKEIEDAIADNVVVDEEKITVEVPKELENHVGKPTFDPTKEENNFQL